MRDHHHRQHQTCDYVADDELDESDIAAIGDCRHTDDREGARLSCHNRKANAPPRNIFAAEEVVSRVLLVFAKPDTQPDDPEQVNIDDYPVCKRQIIHVEFVTLYYWARTKGWPAKSLTSRPSC